MSVDYHSLRALASVIEQQSFELAAQALNITQSAVSQRIHGFESYIGERLLVRKLPYVATAEGEKYLNLLRKVEALEADLQKNAEQKSKVKIAINRDSLDLFFLDVLADSELAEILSIEIIADDQDNTLGYLKNGQVDMCISSIERAIPNHTAIYLGTMSYVLACSPKFQKKHYEKGVSKDSLLKARAIVFDNNDKILFEFLKNQFHLNALPQVNKLPSVLSFKQGLLASFGYGLIPLLDVREEIKSKKLMNLSPKITYSLPLYLHQWEYQKVHFKLFSEKIVKAAKKII